MSHPLAKIARQNSCLPQQKITPLIQLAASPVPPHTNFPQRAQRTFGNRMLAQRVSETAGAATTGAINHKNSGGLPSHLQTGIEALSGIAMNDVKVHYNSAKPAQLQALAYAQGSDIHLAPGQEQHLPHEAWHVVQQKQGRVKPTMQMKEGVAINDDNGLEREADVMGAKALTSHYQNTQPLQQISEKSGVKQNLAIQRKIGFEFQTYDSVTFCTNLGHPNTRTPIQHGPKVGENNGLFKVEEDSGATSNEMEIITVPVDENDAGRVDLQNQMTDITALAQGVANNGVVNALAAGNVTWRDNIAGYHFVVNNQVDFHPQATVGVKFSRIADLIDYASNAPSLAGGIPINGGILPVPADQKATEAQVFGWSGKADQQSFKAASAAGVAEARQDLAGASQKVISFAAILYGLAKISDPIWAVNPADPSYAKYFMPFMLRLGLLPHYNSLSDDERDDLDRIRQSVLDTPFLPNALDNGLDYNINDVINALAEGQDLPSSSIFAGYNASTPGSLGMASNTDIGPSQTEAQRDGAVIELRKLGSDVLPGQLTAYALAVFDFIRLINAPPIHVAQHAPLQPVVAGGHGGGGHGGGKGCCSVQ
jgi:Domain of unknown function (DUF4157)